MWTRSCGYFSLEEISFYGILFGWYHKLFRHLWVPVKFTMDPGIVCMESNKIRKKKYYHGLVPRENNRTKMVISREEAL